jgi:hypothetical protein
MIPLANRVAGLGHLGPGRHIVTIGGLAQDLPVAVLHPRRLEIAEN